MKNKKCIIIHGCPSGIERALDAETRTYDKHWMPWTKNQLAKKGIETETPLMPTPWKPSYKKFKHEFEKCQITERTILIGHSCGCAFLVRWLGETKKKIFKLVLVAPWKNPNGKSESERDFYTYPIDQTIKDRVKEVVMFTADDEEDDGKKSLKMFHHILGGKIICLKCHGHYTQGDMGTKEFPELIKAVSA